MDLLKLIKQLRVAALMSQVYLKPYQTMMVDWLGKYRLNLDDDQSSEEDYVGKTFSKSDFNIQGDLIDFREIELVNNCGVYPGLDRRLVIEFDPTSDKADKLILHQVQDRQRLQSADKK